MIFIKQVIYIFLLLSTLIPYMRNMSVRSQMFYETALNIFGTCALLIKNTKLYFC